MSRHWALIAAAGMAACTKSDANLPDRYTILYGDRGKAWLANPDRTLAHPALIKRLHTGGGLILLISYAATYGGKVEGPRPLDGNCYVALLIESRTQRLKQIHLSEANRIAGNMKLVESSKRGCLAGMPTS